MEPTEEQKLRRTAYHEAGHVVVGWALEHAIAGAWIEPGRGQADVGEAGSCPPHEEALVALAGGIGADLSGIEMYDWREVFGDESQALAYITSEIRNEAALGDDVDDDLALARERLQPMRERAAALIASNRTAFEEVARLLLERRCMSGDELNGLLSRFKPFSG